MKALIESAGGVSSRVRVGKHEIVFDQPASVPGGEDAGPSPLDVLVISVGACAHYFAAAYLHARGLPTAKIRVEVAADKTRARLERLSIHVQLPPGIPENLLPSIERAVRSCPAYGTLVHPPDVQLTVSRELADPTSIAS
jgi:ribosomal protein S12 methylthiotransferase accessory factor